MIGFTRAIAVKHTHTHVNIHADNGVEYCSRCRPENVYLQDASTEGDYGVRINVLCPAFVDTPLLHSVEKVENLGKFLKFKDDFKSKINKFGVLK